MANSTISEIALRDQVVPDTARAERPLVPKPRTARMGEGQNLRVIGLFGLGETPRAHVNQVSAAMVDCAGAPGFFRPRPLNPWFHPPDTIEATSYYGTRPLRATLPRFVDFDRVNSRKDARLSLGAVNVRSGNLTFFDRVIGTEHVMASGALRSTPRLQPRAPHLSPERLRRRLEGL
jgi:hypothetical protein